MAVVKMNNDAAPGNMPPSSKKEEPHDEPQKVVKGKVTTKKSKWTRFQKEASEISSHVVMEIILPEAKNMLYSTVQEFVGRSLFGDSYVAKPAPGKTPYVSYNRVSSNRPVTRDIPRAQRRHEVADIILESRVEAEEVIDALDERIRRYNSVSVADLHALVGLPSSYTDNDWGWTHMRTAASRRVADGYILDLPRPEPLR